MVDALSEAPRQVNDVIHDFDGTIADSGEVNLEVMAEVLNREPFSAEEIEEIRTLTTLEGMARLGVKKWQLPRLLVRGRRIAGQHMHRIDAFEGMPEAIDQLSDDGYGQYVLSTNSEGNIRELLDRHDLVDRMTDICGGSSMLGKARRLTTLIRREGLMAASCVYVGDEARDIEAAREAGMLSVAVAWGFQDPDTLAAHDPDALVTSPSELAVAINSLAHAQSQG